MSVKTKEATRSKIAGATRKEILEALKNLDALQLGDGAVDPPGARGGLQADGRAPVRGDPDRPGREPSVEAEEVRDPGNPPGARPRDPGPKPSDRC